MGQKTDWTFHSSAVLHLRPKIWDKLPLHSHGISNFQISIRDWSGKSLLLCGAAAAIKCLLPAATRDPPYTKEGTGRAVAVGKGFGKLRGTRHRAWSGKVSVDQKKKAQKQNTRVCFPPPTTPQNHLVFHKTQACVYIYIHTPMSVYIYAHAKVSPHASLHFALGYRKRMKEADKPKIKWITRKRFQSLRHYEVPAWNYI